MVTAEDLTEIIIALTGLIAAVAALVAAFRNVHSRIDQTDAYLAGHVHPEESSSPKVLPPNNPE